RTQPASNSKMIVAETDLKLSQIVAAWKRTKSLWFSFHVYEIFVSVQGIVSIRFQLRIQQKFKIFNIYPYPQRIMHS
ncbi:hypothetical protein ACJX0J_019000, partial [Zea mays]